MDFENVLQFAESSGFLNALKKSTSESLENIKKELVEGGFTEDPILDLSIYEFGIDYLDQYIKIHNLSYLLRKYEYQYIQIHQTEHRLYGGWGANLKSKTIYIGELDKNPLEVQKHFEPAEYYKLQEYFLVLNFKSLGALYSFNSKLSNPSIYARKYTPLYKEDIIKLNVYENFDFSPSNEDEDFILTGDHMLPRLFDFLNLSRPDLRKTPSLEELTELINERPKGKSKPNLHLVVSN